jgi:hypothetical protein
MYALQIAESSHGQVAEWILYREPLKHLTQSELDSLIEKIDSFINNEIELLQNKGE